MPPTNPTPRPPTDRQLLDAREKWKTAKWDKHFISLGHKPAGAARYSTTANNDVLKQALAEEFKNRCWYQGSADCQSRAILLRTAQIDHIVQHKAAADILRAAAKNSSYQSGYFDVHDPGNLALICGPCNLERGTRTNLTAAMQDRQADSEQARDGLIEHVEKWYRDAKLDQAVLTAIEGADVTEDETWEVMSTMITDLLERRAGSQLAIDIPVEIQSTQFKFKLEPSDAVIDEYNEWYADNAAEEMKIEQYYARLEAREGD